jgi:serine/threonine protein phosphatase 1
MPGVSLADARGPEGMPLYAIGDVHGCCDLLKRMHSLIRDELRRDKPADWRIIHIGDYVDRGPDSKGVLDFLLDQCARDPRVIALAGNHDLGFLEFLAAPSAYGLFAHNGGGETARSYGVELRLGNAQDLRSSHAALAQAVPPEHVGFLRGLPRSVSFGDFLFCHAGIHPGVALDAQDPEDLVWIREAFLDFPGLHPKVIVHGHTPAYPVELLPNRVNVDTKAFATSRLTAFVVEGGDKRILEVAG